MQGEVRLALSLGSGGHDDPEGETAAEEWGVPGGAACPRLEPVVLVWWLWSEPAPSATAPCSPGAPGSPGHSRGSPGHPRGPFRLLCLRLLTSPPSWGVRHEGWDVPVM